jgi:redox-sensitive bicupin YhaK (pirin superfamily)
MIQLRPGEERGETKIGWLDSRHSFSFSDYYDPAHMGFRSLRVINEDWVAPGQGFGTHPHRDMEILTYVLEGALEHRDSMGTGAVIRPGELQKMSAGTGITHSEFNPSPKSPVHLLQIWIQPDRKGLKPAYEQHTFAKGELDGGFHLIAGPQGVISIHQDAELYAARLEAGQQAANSLKPGRHAWVQLARGQVRLNGTEMKAGDGAAVSGEEKLAFEALAPSEILLFDLA